MILNRFSVSLSQPVLLSSHWYYGLLVRNKGLSDHVLGLPEAPSGDQYQAFEQSFEVAEGSPAATTSQSLQVEGTWIAQRRLTGMWQVNFFLDGKPMGTQAVQLTQ